MQVDEHCVILCNMSAFAHACVSNCVFVFASGPCSPVDTVSVMSAFPSLWSSTVLAIEEKL